MFMGISCAPHSKTPRHILAVGDAKQQNLQSGAKRFLATEIDVSFLPTLP
jgi:hypothetical protein